MTLRRVYNLKDQKITQYHDDLPKTCVCVLLVLLVICGLILAAVCFVKNTQSIGEKLRGETNYQDSGNRENLRLNEGPTVHPNTRHGSFMTTVERNNKISTPNTLEYVSTTIESPLSTTTMPPKDFPPRFLFVNTVSVAGAANSDYYSTAGSTNDDVKVTTNGLDTSSAVKRSTVAAEASNSDYYSTAGSINAVGKVITKGLETSSTAKRSTVTDFIDNEWITNPLNDDYIDDAYLQLSNEGLTISTLTDENSTPSYDLELQEKHQTCSTNLCKQSASRMLALVNHTAEPCDDFYSYACGGFVINHFEEFTVDDRVLQKLPDMSTLNVAVPYEKTYHDFLVSCYNYENGRDLPKVAKLLYDLCVDHKDNLTDFIANIILLHPKRMLSRLLPLFDVVMEVGPEKTLIPLVSLPKLNSLLSGDDDNEMYERSCRKITEMSTTKKNKTKIQEAYKLCVDSEYFKNLQLSIIRLQIFEHIPDFNTKKKAIAYTMRFIKENIIDHLGSISAGELSHDRQETVAVNWLNTVYPEIGWNKLFERLFGTEIAKSITEVRMTHITYLVKIFEFYKTNSFKDIKTSILSMMSVDFNFDFVEPHSITDRSKYCSTAATKLMPDIASMLYLETFNPSDILNAEQKLKLMFDQLVVTFNATLNENIWVNENVREEVSEKISELNLMTNPYQGFVRFEENYRKLYGSAIISTNDYISNVIALKQIARRRMYSTIGQSVISPEVIWNHLVWPTTSSPIRITETTTIVLPTSLIAPFTAESQKIEEFATIGFLVAQEISRFLYTDKSSKLFVNENEDFKVNMEIHLDDPAYSKKPNIYGISLNEEDINASERSRFVDDVALRVTFDAYDQYQSLFDQLMPFTNNSISQMFYILASQQFCSAQKSSVEVAIDLIRNENLPNYFRINSMMINSESFSNAFECGMDP